MSKLCALSLGLVVAFGGAIACVSHVSIADQAPAVEYRPARPILVSVVDERPQLAEGKPNTYIGRAHGVYGIPTDIHVYPYYAEDKQDRKQPLAAALEQRVVLGLASDGAQAVGLGAPQRLDDAEIATALRERSSSKLLLITVRKWFVSLNLNWVTAFNFDWGVSVEVFDGADAPVNWSGEGRDVVDVAWDQSPANHVRLAYRDRLKKILEEPGVRAALEDAAAPAAQAAQPAASPTP